MSYEFTIESFINVSLDEAKEVAVSDEIVHPILWGQDHLTCYRYLETVIVDHQGELDQQNPDKIRVDGWSYPTRCRDKVKVVGHNDEDCINDFIRAGLIITMTDQISNRLRLTDKGWEVAGYLRRCKAEGTLWSLIDIMPILTETPRDVTTLYYHQISNHDKTLSYGYFETRPGHCVKKKSVKSDYQGAESEKLRVLEMIKNGQGIKVSGARLYDLHKEYNDKSC